MQVMVTGLVLLCEATLHHALRSPSGRDSHAEKQSSGHAGSLEIQSRFVKVNGQSSWVC